VPVVRRRSQCQRLLPWFRELAERGCPLLQLLPSRMRWLIYVAGHLELGDGGAQEELKVPKETLFVRFSRSLFHPLEHRFQPLHAPLLKVQCRVQLGMRLSHLGQVNALAQQIHGRAVHRMYHSQFIHDGVSSAQERK
jgi:hypothetical protein